ncbi:hypothetical protein VMCG_05073 [Cytospora schulzeri]|uniref:Uncharacterized protein n=1 Tax=Cytospora schulzeri TaxID=448051 RepID=A0A423WN21_9PEZI|nr:hypothetical protein VMCG_05073 [Valsa malicola]
MADEAPPPLDAVPELTPDNGSMSTTSSNYSSDNRWEHQWEANHEPYISGQANLLRDPEEIHDEDTPPSPPSPVVDINDAARRPLLELLARQIHPRPVRPRGRARPSDRSNRRVRPARGYWDSPHVVAIPRFQDANHHQPEEDERQDSNREGEGPAPDQLRPRSPQRPHVTITPVTPTESIPSLDIGPSVVSHSTRDPSPDVTPPRAPTTRAFGSRVWHRLASAGRRLAKRRRRESEAPEGSHMPPNRPDGDSPPPPRSRGFWRGLWKGLQAETKAVQHPVQAQGAQQAVDDTAEAKTTEQAADDAQDTAEEQADGGNDLEEGLAQESPQGAELLLGVRHVLELALGAVDCLGDGAVDDAYLLDNLSKVELLRRGLASAGLVLGVGLDVTVRVEAPDDAVGLAEDVAALLDERADLLDQGLLVALLLGLALHGLDLGRDHLADGLDLVEALLQAHGHLRGELLVLLPLQPLLLLLLRLALGLRLLRDVADQVHVAHRHALGVDHVPVVVDLLARADERVARGQLAHQVALVVDDVALLVDGQARHRALLLLDLLGRPALRLAEHVAVLVDDVTVLVDGTAGKDLGVARDEAADDVAGRGDDLAVLGDGQALQVGEGALLGTLALTLGHELRVAEDVTGLADDLAVLVAHTADHALEITVNNTAVDNAVAVDDVSGLVDTLASKNGKVDLGLRLGSGSLFLLPALGLADDVAGLVEDLAIRVDSLALEDLEVTLDDLADLLAVPHDVALAVDGVALEGLKGLGLHHVLELIVGDGLGAADLLAAVVPDLSFLINLAADQVFRDALNDAADSLALVVDDVAELVDRAALQDGVVDLGHVGGRLVGVARGGLQVLGLVDALGQCGASLGSLALGASGLGLGALVGVTGSSLEVLGVLNTLGQRGTGLGASLGAFDLGAFRLGVLDLFCWLLGEANLGLRALALGTFGLGCALGQLSLGLALGNLLRWHLGEAHLGLALGLLLGSGFFLLSFGVFTWQVTVVSGALRRLGRLLIVALLAVGGGLKVLRPVDALGEVGAGVGALGQCEVRVVADLLLELADRIGHLGVVLLAASAEGGDNLARAAHEVGEFGAGLGFSLLRLLAILFLGLLISFARLSLGLLLILATPFLGLFAGLAGLFTLGLLATFCGLGHVLALILGEVILLGLGSLLDVLLGILHFVVSFVLDINVVVIMFALVIVMVAIGVPIRHDTRLLGAPGEALVGWCLGAYRLVVLVLDGLVGDTLWAADGGTGCGLGLSAFGLCL